MSLYKRGGVWWNYYYIDGLRHQQSTGTGNLRRAESIAQKQREEANDRRHQAVQVDPELSFGGLAARFLAEGTVKPHHLDRLNFLLPYFGDLRITHLTRNLLEDYRRKRQKSGGVSDATVNRDLSVLRRILNWGLDASLIVANPFGRIRMARERRKKRAVLSVGEEDRILVRAPEHLRRLIITALDTGMRRGELLSQLWEDVDFSRRLLSVTHSKTPEGEAREIPLTARVYELLSAMRRESGPVFTYHDKPFAAPKTAWKSTLVRAQVRHIRFHDLRHTFNTRLMEAGVLQEIRMELMGHSGGGRVHMIYTHIELPTKRKAIASLEQWLTEQRQQMASEGGQQTDMQPANSGGNQP